MAIVIQLSVESVFNPEWMQLRLLLSPPPPPTPSQSCTKASQSTKYFFKFSKKFLCTRDYSKVRPVRFEIIHGIRIDVTA